ncbi:hypothetical protein [Rhizohabitans arisaemae]|uniref:hypothetical protein n=1 Tax=Rhizohabitans arisaemae TaxID=2720610 RepID=UPI0024B0A003|nr:hypothetical protein [Rhizohabitans arisaemae]
MAIDRHYQGIVRHMMLSLLVGVLAGLLGSLVSGSLVALVYNPYVYFLIPLVIGRRASGVGWSALAASLAVIGMLCAQLVVVGFGGTQALGALGVQLTVINIVLIGWIMIGVLGYLTRFPGLRGDLAAALLAGRLFADLFLNLPFAIHVLVVALAVVVVVTVRPGWRSWLRSLAVALPLGWLLDFFVPIGLTV